MIRKSVLVELIDKQGVVGLVICDPYMTIVTTVTPTLTKKNPIEKVSSEVLAVDILVDGVLYKKVALNKLKRVR